MTKFRIVRQVPEKVRCDLLAVPIYKGGTAGPGAEAVAKVLGKLSDLLELNMVKGDLGDALVLPTYGKLPAKQVALIGLGERGKAGAFQIRRAGAVLARRAGAARVVATTLPSAAKGSEEETLGAFVQGFLLGSYRFDRYKKASKDGPPPGVKEVVIVGSGNGPAAVLERARVIAEATALARDLTNVPAADQGPQTLAEEARRVARRGGLTVKVFDEKQLAAKGFNGILGVGRGSTKPPRLIEIRYTSRGAKRTVAIVGKGITFDSGGINLKNQGLDWMKMDMGGGAAVIATMSAVARLKPKVNVIGLVCSAENMPGGNALHPGDVLSMFAGKTVEVGDTDAEGRLVMADGIAYARTRGATTIVDIATLTGSAMIALGPKSFAVLGNDPKVVRGLLGAAERAGEHAWELPMYEEYRKMLDSDIADIKNVGGRYGGAITAALFLKEFVGEVSWAHLDIAGTAKSDSDEFELPKGATGSGVRTLVEWLTSL